MKALAGVRFGRRVFQRVRARGYRACRRSSASPQELLTMLLNCSLGVFRFDDGAAHRLAGPWRRDLEVLFFPRVEPLLDGSSAVGPAVFRDDGIHKERERADTNQSVQRVVLHLQPVLVRHPTCERCRPRGRCGLAARRRSAQADGAGEDAQIF